LKLAQLLAQYLYTNKHLELPGLGIFLLDPNIEFEQVTDKQGKKMNMEGVTFESNPSVKQNPDLISFISAQSGKIKALASADLESHLELAIQFMNIGKPFMLEGIGSLTKTKSGEFAFSSGEMLPEAMKGFSARELSSTSSSEESFTDYNSSVFGPSANRTQWKKPLIFSLVVAGIALAIWGGYTLYKNTSSGETTENEVVKENEKVNTAITKDTSSTLNDTVMYQKDSAIETLTPPVNPVVSGSYKFVIEVANKQRSLKRFSALKSYGLNVQMETKDSVEFKLFFILPAAVTDTTRILDSIKTLYSPLYFKAFIEK
jgi:hypothetical protein